MHTQCPNASPKAQQNMASFPVWHWDVFACVCPQPKLAMSDWFGALATHPTHAAFHAGKASGEMQVLHPLLTARCLCPYG